MRNPAIAVAALFLAGTPVDAQRPHDAAPQELVTDRPDQTESTATIPQGYVQIETGVTYTDDGDNRDVTYPGTLLRIGLAERVELRLAADGWLSELDGDEETGFGDMELGLKLRLWEQRGALPEAALLIATTLPTGETGFSSERSDPSFRFSFAHDITKRFSLGYNVGVSWETEEEVTPRPVSALVNNALAARAGEGIGAVVDGAVGGGPLLFPIRSAITDTLTQPFTAIFDETRSDRDTLSTYQYTVAGGIEFTPRLGAFLELFGDVPLNAPGTPSHSLDGGVTYLLLDNLQVDFAGGIGLNQTADDWFLGIGLSVRFPG